MTSTNQPSSATTAPADNGPDRSVPAADPAGLLRAWTSTGAQLFDRERATREGHNYATGPDAVTTAIDTLTWQTLPADGTLSAPFSPGEAIKTLITEMRLGQVTALAWNGAVDVRDDVEHAAGLYGLYGIDAVHAGYRVRIYAVDRGTDLLIVAVDAPPALATALDPTAGLTPTH
ncbi:hypothetical protein SAMN03159343_4107 [Klenkia marina]|uniref:Uncharacterized protein n=1 Tax=Klenkia marina TaxID=1960309 RepID=A0A1G4Z4C0_9ACTN|nr:hypothetical protein [Klenkia marina]SCX60497.1 hypothetical protein SAMN03159343_4107 [Klenkia marina]